MSCVTRHLSKTFWNLKNISIESWIPFWSFHCQRHIFISYLFSSTTTHFVIFKHLVYWLWLTVAFLMMAREIALPNNNYTSNLITMYYWFVDFRKIPPLNINYTMVEGKCGLFFKYGKKFRTLFIQLVVYLIFNCEKET